DNGNALPPGQGCRPKTHDLYVLFFTEHVRDTNRIILNKIGAVVLSDFRLKKRFEIDHNNLSLRAIAWQSHGEKYADAKFAIASYLAMTFFLKAVILVFDLLWLPADYKTTTQKPRRIPHKFPLSAKKYVA